MFKLAICDSEHVEAAYIEDVIIEYASRVGKRITTEVYQSATELYKEMKAGECFDLIFLEVKSGSNDGFNIGNKIRNELDNQNVHIVYMSTRDNCSIELFEARPMNFLEKPLIKCSIIKNLEQCMKLTGWIDQYFEYKKGHQTYKIPKKNIMYFESMGRKVKMVSTKGEELFYGKLEEVYENLKGDYFLDIHRSYVVNYIHITEFKYEEIKVGDYIQLPVSQARRKRIKEIHLGLVQYRNSY